MSGTFGYEMDLSRCTDEEKENIRRQIAFYKSHYDLISRGDYYRLTNPFDHKLFTAWEHVSADRRKALVSVVFDNIRPASPFHKLCLKGLDPSLQYRINGKKKLYSGALLMQAGYPLPIIQKDYQSLQFYLEAKE